MKQIKSILFAFCCTALLSQVAFGADHPTVTKTHNVYCVDQLTAAAIEFPSVAETFIFSTVVENSDVTVFGNGYANNHIAWMPPDRIQMHSIFAFAVLPDCLRSPSGNIMYLKTNKPFYRSPSVDDKWKWQFSQMYNC